MQLILASASPARLALLRQAGIEPTVTPTDLDEDLLIAAHEAEHGPLAPADYVLLLARAKAEALLDEDPLTGVDGLVLGGDSSLELDGAMLGKPHTPERARERWLAQRGRSATLHSGHWMLRVRHGRILGTAGVATATHLDFSPTSTRPRSTPTSRPASRSRWPARSRSTGAEPPSSTGSTATRRRSWG